jgi:L-ascorbate metabolism protein UlaG (beta-lactamase superfamily)
MQSQHTTTTNASYQVQHFQDLMRAPLSQVHFAARHFYILCLLPIGDVTVQTTGNLWDALILPTSLMSNKVVPFHASFKKILFSWALQFK